jgi:hypothetical protein
MGFPFKKEVVSFTIVANPLFIDGKVMKKLLPAAACALLLTAGVARAEEAAAPATAPTTAPTTAPVVVVPKSTCTQPEPAPRLNPKKAQVDRFNREYKAYVACVQAYVAERNAAAKAHLEAGNALVKESNDLANKLNAAASGE